MNIKQQIEEINKIDYLTFKTWFYDFPNLRHPDTAITQGLSRDTARVVYERLKSQVIEIDKVMEVMDKIVSWTCDCNCVTFDNKKCRGCGSSPAYGGIDYDELKKEIQKLNNAKVSQSEQGGKDE